MKKHAWMSLTSFCSLCVLVGCSASIPPVKTYEAAAKEVDARGSLVSPPIEQREGYEAGTATRLDKGQAAPHSGSLLDEKKVILTVAVKAERDRRRTELEVERRRAAIQKIIYESTIANLQAQATARGMWWEQNKGLVGFALGTTIGMAIIIGVMYALTGGKSIEVKSGALTPAPVR